MRLILLYGQPATGKLTVARELSAITGYRLFHNHMVVDLLLSLFAFGTQPFVELREEIWLSIFARAAGTGLEGIIFTFCPETTVRPGFIPQLVRATEEGSGEVIPIELTCPLPELRRRLANPSRATFGKLTSPELFEQLHAANTFDSTHMPGPRLTLDTSEITPTEAARQIVEALHRTPLA